MPIPPHRAPGDLGHIDDHNDISDVLTDHADTLSDVDTGLSTHTGGADPHGDRAYADATKSAIGHVHTYPVTSVNSQTGVVVLTAASVGAETTSGAQAKVDALAATVVPLTQRGANNGVATLDGAGKIPSGQLPAGSGVTSVNGQSGSVTLTAADVSAIATSQKAAANGVASLDGSTLVPTAQIPSLAATKITSGTLDVARVPTGTSSTTVSLGNHTHTYPVSSVNSQTGAVVLAAADVGALATSARGAASGVASLDGSTLIPTSQIPSLSATYVATSTRGAASGVATLDADTTVPEAQAPVYNFTAADHGFLAWSFAPEYLSTAGSLTGFAAGALWMTRVKLLRTATISKVTFITTAAGNTLTNSYVALYDSTGTRRAVTADQSATWAGAGGIKAPTFVTPYSAAPGYYWIAWLVGSATTLPTLARAALGGGYTGVINFGLTAGAGNLRSATYGSAQTSAPSTITTTSMVSLEQLLWGALS